MRLLCEVVAAVLFLLSSHGAGGAGTGTGVSHCTREWAQTPDATVGLRSINHDGQQERKLRMVNTCADEVVIYWMDLNGEEVELKRLKPGRKISMMTSTGHAFRVYFAARFTSVRADLPESALPRSTSRQLALEHTVHLDVGDDNDEKWVQIAPCGADATPFHHQRMKSTDQQTAAELPSTDSHTRPTPGSTDKSNSETPTPAHEEDQRRLQELEEQLQRREAEAAARQAEQDAREEELRVSLEQAQAAVRQQEEQARLATEAAAVAMAQATASSANSQQHTEVKEDDVEEDLVVTASVTLACVLAATTAWLYSQLRKSASANVELLRKVQQEPHVRSITASSESAVAEGGVTIKQPSASSGNEPTVPASVDRADDSVTMSKPQWTTAEMRRAAAAVNKEQSFEGDSSSRDDSKKRGGSAEAALRATEEQLRAALVVGSASTATQSLSHNLEEGSSPTTPKRMRTAMSASSPISPQSSLSELEHKLQELGARDGRLGKLLLEASAQGILKSPSSSTASASTIIADSSHYQRELAVADVGSGRRGEGLEFGDEAPDFDDEPTEHESVVGGSSMPVGPTEQVGLTDSTSASPSDRLLARVVSRGRPGEDI